MRPDPACLQCGARMADEPAHEAWHQGLITMIVALIRDKSTPA